MNQVIESVQAAAPARDVRLPLVLPARLPCPPGKSPFHIKGSAYSGIRANQARSVPGGISAVLDKIGDPATRDYLSQQFLPNEWYDYLPALLLAGAAVAAVGKPAELVLREMAIRHAEGDLKGIYRVLLFFTSPETAMRRMAVVGRQYFDFGRTEVKIASEGVAQTVIAGIPAIAASFYELYISEFVHRLLVLSGAKQPRAVWQPPVPDGERSGFPTVTLRVETRWSR